MTTQNDKNVVIKFLIMVLLNNNIKDGQLGDSYDQRHKTNLRCSRMRD